MLFVLLPTSFIGRTSFVDNESLPNQTTHSFISSMMTDEYSIEHVYQGFNNVIDQSDNQSIRLHEFINAFRELTK
jgi:hypothetical protein